VETRVFMVILARAFVLFRQELDCEGYGDIEIVGKFTLECVSAHKDVKHPLVYEMTERGWDYAESSYQRLIPEMYRNMIHQLSQ